MVASSFFCENCGAIHPKWQGQCKSCKEWNTVIEEVIQKDKKPAWSKKKNTKKTNILKVSEISIEKDLRIQTQNKELNRVLGGGVVPGSVILLSGEPGVGKSTLMLQLVLGLKNCKSLYVTGEESNKQIKMRADRLEKQTEECFILTETATNKIFKHIEEIEPNLVVVDSIQTLQTISVESYSGSVSQIRETAYEFIRFAKETDTPVILLGHITKTGGIAGPKILEHMVDVVLHFQGDRNYIYRILRANKNRFGSTSEIGVYEMSSAGLKEILNPSKILISQREEALSGGAIAAAIEGVRPLLVEVQALVGSAVYGTPQRSATGFDLRRMNMLLAVLEKRCGFKLGAKDVFLNITGGVKVDDPSIDLGVVASILSSNEDLAISEKICFSGEVGLSGEIRPATRVEQRILEAEKLGFEQIFISSYNKIRKSGFAIKIVEFSKVEEVFQSLFT